MMRLFEPSLRMLANRNQGSMPAHTSTGYGTAPLLGRPASLPNTMVKTTKVRSGHRPGDADRGLLVAEGHVTPGVDGEQLAVMPKIAPVVTLRAPCLKHNGAFQARGQTALSAGTAAGDRGRIGARSSNH